MVASRRQGKATAGKNSFPSAVKSASSGRVAKLLAKRHDEVKRPRATRSEGSSELPVLPTYYFSLRPVSTFVTTSSVPFRSPVTVTEFSAAAFASSLSKPDST